MIHLSKEKTKLMVAVHGWSGILLGLLLYAVVLTGTAAVFAEEVGIWSAGHVRTTSAFARPLDSAIRDLAAHTPERFHEGVNLFEMGDHDLGVYFHRDEMAGGRPITRGVYYRIDAEGRLASAQRGTDEEIFGPSNDDALKTFLVDTHVRLHLPNPWGLLLTGILGLAMLVAAISGLLIHRHLLKDIFTLRRSANPVLVDRDRHSVAGTWSLPFAFVLAFTGSFFSFYGTVGVPIVAMAAFGGDVGALNETVYGNPGKADPRPAPVGNLDRIMADATRRAGGVPTFVGIEKFGRADAEITSYHQPAAGDLEPATLLYRGATGQFERVKPAIGTRASAGGSLVGIMAPMHFGNFAGLLSKAVWFALGFAMCYVSLTGFRLWLVRRRGEARSLDWLDRTVTTVAVGLPVALIASAVAFIIAMPEGTAVFWTPAAFVIASAAVIAGAALMRSPAAFERALWLAMAIGMLILPPLRLALGGPGWAAAIDAGQPIIPALDLAFLAAGGWLTWRTKPRRAVTSEPLATLMPAE
ncbi:PepSY-associated TM helix domain-containing protein [Sphingomonas jatrophae]|uniref:Uncharacterized iron-regulated membrane protein n=1 Tax=Sphingomonas jatrophae TaxID=1166337 RepID=A0A1I6K3G2_9SPHN|nr:PepSY-associated TM helix domain-containing protein [Sphingomonas jatrophae]SFR85360.1 Uncharacterized iron-regulated membrane protein [Sphingomonas jatrophae]